MSKLGLPPASHCSPYDDGQADQGPRAIIRLLYGESFPMSPEAQSSDFVLPVSVEPGEAYSETAILYLARRPSRPLCSALHGCS
jgi:hypothetical protein